MCSNIIVVLKDWFSVELVVFQMVTARIGVQILFYAASVDKKRQWRSLTLSLKQCGLCNAMSLKLHSIQSIQEADNITWLHYPLHITTICKVINARKRLCFEGSCVIRNLVQERILVLQTTATSAGIIQLCGWQTYDCITIIELKKQMGIIFLQQTVQQASKKTFKPASSTALSHAPLIRLEKFRESVIISAWPLLSDHNNTHTARRIFVPSVHCSRRHNLIIKSSRSVQVKEWMEQNT